MRDAHKVTEVAISTTSTEPLGGIVEIGTADSAIRFELNEDMAHELCTHLDRFLTQTRRQSKTARYG